MRRDPKGRLELTWMGKDSALIPVEEGKYDYDWVDPADPRALEVKCLDIVDRVGDSDGPTGANQNLLIVGDSGDALRSLGAIPEYASRYRGQVKLAYIDPPFNTGQTFENYADQMEHSIWLTMMRDRIRDIRPLLAPDASIWVHLDDAEVHRMRVLLDEEFGEDNFVATVVWQRVDNPSSRSSERIVPSHDFILVYSVGPQFRANRRLIGELPDHYDRLDESGRPYCSRSLRKAGAAARREDRPSMWFPIVSPDGQEVWPIRGDGSEGRWQWGQEKVNRDYSQLDWLPSVRGGTEPFIRIYPPDDYAVPYHTWWPYQEVGSNRISKMEIKALLPDNEPFATPKPEALIRRVIEVGSEPGDLVLDCFAGSGTTAAVAHKLGRRWLTVELQERTVRSTILPRLRKVVDGSDSGGISVRSERVHVGPHPQGCTAEEAHLFTSLLKKFSSDLGPEHSDAIRLLKEAARTKVERVVEWSGGGGFAVAHMGPSMYDVDDAAGEVYLSPAATNGVWSRAIAGQLRFTHTPDHPVFCGVRGRQRLVVIDGVVDEVVVRSVVEHLGEKERAVIVGKSVLPAAVQALTEISPGSRIKKAPTDIFPKGTVK